MAIKKTVIEMFEGIKSVPGLTDEQIAFLDKRIELTAKKNAKNASAEPTPKQREKMAQTEAHKTAILSVMVEGATYTPSDLVKLVGNSEIPNTQKITPMLTAMVNDGVLTKSTVKGRSVYSLPSVAEVAEG
jgi:hypothetical protein